MRRENYTDQEIIEGIRHQNADILLFIYKKNFRSVKYYIEKNKGNQDDAEDLFHDAFILLFDKIREGTLDIKCSFHTYFFSIVKFSWIRQLALKDKNVQLNDYDNFICENTGIVDDFVKNERKKIFLQHFSEISSDCQKIIRLVLKGYSIQEITRTMGYASEQHTKNRRFRCKKTLMERILRNPHFKELTNERSGKDYSIPRW